MINNRQLVLLVTELVVYVSLSATFGNIKSSATYELVHKRQLANQQGIINIDCGADQDYVDEETGIFYKSDGEFISTGENQDILPQYNFMDHIFWQRLKSVRSFPNGRKNCYKLRPEQGKNHNYRITAHFKYGNYDFKNQNPTFSISVGVNLWSSITIDAPSSWILSEIVYFSLTDTIDVCLVNTGSGTPFISFLELRFLNLSDHRDESRPLVSSTRIDFGLSKSNWTVRYNDDIYNRYWRTYTPPDCIPIDSEAEIKTQSNSSNYFSQLPSEVWRSAVQPVSPLTSINISWPCSEMECYFCFHFAEILETTKTREFTLSLNNFYYGTISLRYLDSISICHTVSVIQGSYPPSVQFLLNSTDRSDLPPIINGLQVLKVTPFTHSPTFVADVEGMMAIMQTYNINRDQWQGDPCVPRELSWDGLNCSYDTIPPRIISLDLSSSRLTGEISTTFFTLKALKSLNLSYNELKGTVPDFLAELPNLTVLNLTENKLSGLVPQTLVEKSNDGTLQLSLVGNPKLCLTADSCKKRRSFLVPITLSIITVLVLLLSIGIIIYWRTKGQVTAESKNESSSGVSKNRCFSFSEIVSITNNFGTMIGEGGFGKVYLGTLMDNKQVAVKLLSQVSRQGFKAFQAEAQLLMVVHHGNLVSLIGYCDDNDKKALIYEYMANGNLREHLSETRGRILKWEERLKISVDAAHGLEYLHNGCKPPIIHRDLKTSNILLNEKFQAKIADFGLSRAFDNESDTHMTTEPAGTYGYMDPDVHASGNFNKKSDIYSFGIILLELISGQPAIIRDAAGNMTHILKRVIPITESGDIGSIIDPKLHGQFDANSAWKAVEIALACALNPAMERPDMSHVLVELKECLATAITVDRSQRIEGRTRSINSLGRIDTDDMLPSPR